MPSPSLMPQVIPPRGVPIESSLRTAVIVDYQNIHLTGWEVFGEADGKAIHECLIDPARYAQRVVTIRNRNNRHTAPAELRKTMVFRGLPSPDHDADGYRRSQDQKRNWINDGVEVILRPLKYYYERDASGRPIKDLNGRKTPVGPPEEKGIDILIALHALLLAQSQECDLVIIASHDSDMAPIVEVVHRLHKEQPDAVARIETTSWYLRNPEGWEFKSKINGGKGIWNTRLERADHQASLDTRAYR